MQKYFTVLILLQVSDARQLVSTTMDDEDGQIEIVARDSRITAITLDSLNGYKKNQDSTFQLLTLMLSCMKINVHSYGPI